MRKRSRRIARHAPDGNAVSPPLVIAVGGELASRAYPVEALDTGSRILHDEVNGTPVVIFWDAALRSAAVFEARVNGTELRFHLGDADDFLVVDSEDGRWTSFGHNLDGSTLRLAPFPFDVVHADVWAAYHPDGVIAEMGSLL